MFGSCLDAQKLAEAENQINLYNVHALSRGSGRRAQLWEKYGLSGPNPHGMLKIISNQKVTTLARVGSVGVNTFWSAARRNLGVRS